MKKIICSCTLLFCLITLPLYAETPPVTYPPSKIKQDFSQLYNELKEAHFNLFTSLSEADYNRAFEQFYARINEPMTEAQIRLLFQEFVALGDVAHANVDLPLNDFMEYRANGGAVLPLFVRLDADGVKVSDYFGDNPAILPGQTLHAINGKPVEAWLTQFSKWLSADNQRLTNSLIERLFPFLIWLASSEKEVYQLDVVANETHNAVTINSLPYSKWQRPDVWKAAQSDTDFGQRDAYMIDDRLAYLRPGPFYNIASGSHYVWDRDAFEEFIDNAFAHFIDQSATTLIIDLRDNPGGGAAFSDYMLAWIADRPFNFTSEFLVKVSPQSTAANDRRIRDGAKKGDVSFAYQTLFAQHTSGDVVHYPVPMNQPRQGKRFTGDVFALINRYTFSNAVLVAAIIQDYHFGKVIGEKTADLATTLGAMEYFSLEHTGIRVNYPKAFIVRPNGDRTRDGVTPDITLGEVKLHHVAEIIREQVTSKRP